ncbi:MAG: hypothetical protein R2879_22115 [Saprospiraceae bacterium]
MEKAGLVASGINPDSGLVEIVEIKDHPWFVGVQFHRNLNLQWKNRILYL